jgi:hypothetical protein
MNTTKGMHQLSEMFKGKDWFHDVGVDPYGRLVVYVKYACEETIRHIPDTADGIQVLVHFAGSVTARKEDFVASPSSRLVIQNPDYMIVKREVPKVVDISQEAEYIGQEEDELEELPSSFLVSDIGVLARELDRLERICGSNILQDIFYEIHDGKNAVTNLSARYTDVRDSLKELYEEYGFDVIYEEMDG